MGQTEQWTSRTYHINGYHGDMKRGAGGTCKTKMRSQEREMTGNQAKLMMGQNQAEGRV